MPSRRVPCSVFVKLVASVQFWEEQVGLGRIRGSEGGRLNSNQFSGYMLASFFDFMLQPFVSCYVLFLWCRLELCLIYAS